MNIVTACSGIDAIAYAAALLDIDIIGQIEIDEFCNKVLELRYPGVKRLKNVFDVRGDEFGAVDIFAAGFPCQPFSHAGKRKGNQDDRYLWPEIARIIQRMQPTWCLLENVNGIGSMEQSDRETIMETETEICQDAEMVLETVRKDLEEAGYQSIPIIIPAAGVRAPHQRYRIFIMAHSVGGRCGKNRECGGLEGVSRERQDNTMQVAEPDTLFRTEIVGASRRSTQPGMGGNADGLPSGIYGLGGQEDSSGVLGAFETIFAATLDKILWPAGYGAEQHAYEPPRVATGIKQRTNRLKSLGNSIVPWVIFSILLAIKLMEGDRYENIHR
jgi:DNA (cytosine-5)-methyltransferase 1